MAMNFHSEALPCGCLPGYRRCEAAQRMRQELDNLWRTEQAKPQCDQNWEAYTKLNNKYMLHIKVDLQGRVTL